MTRYFTWWTTLAANVVLIGSVVLLTSSVEKKIYGTVVQYPHKLFYDVRALMISTIISGAMLSILRRKYRHVAEEQEKCNLIAENMDEGLIEANRTGKVIGANLAASTMFLDTDLPGKDLEDLMPDTFKARHHRGLIRFIATGKSRILGKTILLSAVRSNGEEFPISLRVHCYGKGASLRFFGLIRDLSSSYIVDVKGRDVPDLPSAEPAHPREVKT